MARGGGHQRRRGVWLGVGVVIHVVGSFDGLLIETLSGL